MSVSKDNETHLYDAITAQYVSYGNNDTLRVLLRNMSINQLRYIAVRPFYRTDKAAAEQIGLTAYTVARWENKADVDRAITLLAQDAVVVARAMIERASVDAAQTVIDIMSDRADPDASIDITTRLKASQDLLNRSGIVPPSRLERLSVSHATITHRHVADLSDNELASMLSIEQDTTETDYSETIDGMVIVDDTDDT